MIDDRSKQVHVTEYSRSSHVACKTPICDCDIMFVRQVIVSGITLQPHVDQLVTSTLALTDSNMMMQLCCYYREVKNLQP